MPAKKFWVNNNTSVYNEYTDWTEVDEHWIVRNTGLESSFWFHSIIHLCSISGLKWSSDWLSYKTMK